MTTVRSAIENTVSISQFNRGQAGKIFEEVKQSGAKVVMKNNVPECVLMSPEQYIALLDALEDAKLEALAMERLSHYDPEKTKTIPWEEVLREQGITQEELDAMEDVEFE